MSRALVQFVRSELGTSLSASTGRGFNIVLSLASGIILARWLGPDGRGQFAVAASITVIGVQCVTLGFPASIAYFGSVHPGSLRALLLRAQGVVAAASILFAIVVLGIRVVFQPQWCGTIDGPLFGAALVNVLASSALLVTQGACLAANEVWRYGWSDAVARLLTVIALAILAFIDTVGPLSALVCCVAATSVTLVWLIKAMSPRIIGDEGGVPALGSELRYGFRSALAGALGTIPVRVITIAVAARDGDAEGGQFAVALSVAETIVILGGTFAATRMCRMVEARHDPLGLRHELLRTLGAVGAGAIVCGVALGAIAHPVFRLAFGERFIPAAGLLVDCLPGAVCLATASVFQWTLAARGLPIMALAAPAVSALVTWVLLAASNASSATNIGSVYSLQGVAFLVASAIALAWNLRTMPNDPGGPMVASTNSRIAP